MHRRSGSTLREQARETPQTTQTRSLISAANWSIRTTARKRPRKFDFLEGLSANELGSHDPHNQTTSVIDKLHLWQLSKRWIAWLLVDDLADQDDSLRAFHSSPRSAFPSHLGGLGSRGILRPSFASLSLAPRKNTAP